MALSLYTDGSCHPNPGGRGGYCAVLVKDGKPQWEISGRIGPTTNNRAELIALIEGLKHVPAGTRLTVITDSQYVQKGASVWIERWIRHDWAKTTNGVHHAVKNADLWKEISRLKQTLHCKFVWVRGHAGDMWNEYCDLTAQARRKDTDDAPIRHILDGNILDYKKEMQFLKTHP